MKMAYQIIANLCRFLANPTYFNSLYDHLRKLVKGNVRFLKKAYKSLRPTLVEKAWNVEILVLYWQHKKEIE